MKQVKIYIRRNGSYGAKYGSVCDTGHCIHENSRKFTVWSIDGSGRIIADAATEQEAESAIAYDWKIS